MLDSARYQAEDDADRGGDVASDRSLADDIKALVSDGRLLAEAEIDFQKKRAIYGARQGGNIAVLFGLAGVLVFFALMGLVFGLILALGQVITYWGSTAVVVGGLLLIAALLVSRGKAKVRHLKTVVSDDGDDA